MFVGSNKKSMETTHLTENITVACVRAVSFPEGVLAAHQQVHNRYSFDGSRRFFGISWAVKGQIQYLAGAELLPGEEAGEGFEILTLRSGAYRLIVIPDFRKDIPAIGNAFQQMLGEPGYDPEGACVEWYPNMTDVHCMLRIAD
jgi:hypothetical protein